MPSGAGLTIGCMLEVRVVCSACAEESEVLVEDLDDLDRGAPCLCGHGYVAISVAEFVPLYAAEGGEVVELRPRRRLPRAA